MQENLAAPCACQNCPGASCNCGCQRAAAPQACACGSQCGCGNACACGKKPA